jgi:hypothetical protein
LKEVEVRVGRAAKPAAFSMFTDPNQLHDFLALIITAFALLHVLFPFFDSTHAAAILDSILKSLHLNSYY